MKTVKIAIVGLLLGALASCGSEPDTNTATAAEPAREKPKGIIPEGQLQALEKAKGVDETLQEADDKRRKAMKEQGI